MIVPTFYHGTDARIVRMSSEERISFKNDRRKALEYMWQFYEPYTLEHTHRVFVPEINGFVHKTDLTFLKEKLGFSAVPRFSESNILYWNLESAINNYQLYLNGCGQWQYEDDVIYLTGNKDVAWRYARCAFAFGELGLFAYRMIQGQEKIQFKGWNPNDEVRACLMRIKTFAETKAEPIIVPIKGLDEDALFTDKGKPINELDELLLNCGLSVKYTKPITLDLMAAIYPPVNTATL